MEEKPRGLRKGTWTQEEDNLLRACVHKYGEGKWHLVPHRAGLRRCRKSCRIRWLNYLKPDIRRGDFSEDEVDLIMRIHKLLGNRWSLIARRLPGRTANDVKNFWHTKMSNINKSEKDVKQQLQPEETVAKVKSEGHVVIKPQPYAFSENSPWMRKKKNNNNKNKLVTAATSDESSGANNNNNNNNNNASTSSSSAGGSSFPQSCPHPPPLAAAGDLSKIDELSDQDQWWESLLEEEEGGGGVDEGQYGNSMMDFLDPDFLQWEGLQSWWTHYS